MSIKGYIDGLTTERILFLASRDAGFTVHRYRRRDAKVAERVRKLVKEGWLSRIGRDREVVIYRITEAALKARKGNTHG